jgi:antitoxin component of MazEF toxin-antitoxin module
VEFEICKVGDSLMLKIPSGVASKLQWEQGDILAFEAADDGLKLVRVQTKHGRAMKFARDAMQRYRRVFETLAKT